MYRRSLMLTPVMMVVAGFWTGCAQPQGGAACTDMKAPARAKEMEMLDKWVGTWTSTTQCKMTGMDKDTNGTAKSTITSACDGRFVMEQMEGDMGEMGKMTGVAMYTWDPAKKHYRTWWFDSFGTSAEGTMCYCPESKTWYMKGESISPMTGKPTIGEGTIKMSDDNTMEFKWTESEKTLFGKKKTMDMTGTSKRG